MSDLEALLKKGKLVDDFLTAKGKVKILQEEARREAMVLEGIVQFLQSGGTRGKISMGMPPETYLSEKLAKLVSDLRDSLQEMNALIAALDGIGIRVFIGTEKVQ